MKIKTEKFGEHEHTTGKSTHVKTTEWSKGDKLLETNVYMHHVTSYKTTTQSLVHGGTVQCLTVTKQDGSEVNIYLFNETED